jgi:hypothetical protein
MTKMEVKTVLERVPTWPEDRQHELAELAVEIKNIRSGPSPTFAKSPGIMLAPCSANTGSDRKPGLTAACALSQMSRTGTSDEERSAAAV